MKGQGAVNNVKIGILADSFHQSIKIAKDKFEREQALKSYQEAHEQKGDVKQAIFEEQKKKEQELKDRAKEIMEA
jgi:predicted small secreted protein